MAKKIWNWKNFKGGLADNPYLVQEGQYQEGVNVDVHTEPNGFKLSSDFSSALTTASSVVAMLD